MKIVIAYSEDADWEGLYINGRLRREASYISADDVLRALDEDYEFRHCDEDWFEVEGCFPEQLDDVQED